ncbi:DUF4232 domain-containing protein [Streptomyces sp. NPDC048248]|uniref:DUF4232 domain-containing protein n=1 Tax=Streptomyces sp. NPDC048248 TaxID=3365523 RepID=UPI003711CD04
MSLTSSSLRRGRQVAAAAMIGAAALALTACQDGKSSAAPHSSAQTTAASSASDSGAAGQDTPGKESGTARAASGSGPSAQLGTDRCTSQDMSLRLGHADPGAGNIHYPLVFTNTGKSTCALRGFPGVSLRAGDGRQIGAPATHEGGAGKVVKLAPGRSAHAVLHTLNDGVKDVPCRPTAKIVYVYAPGSTDAMTARTEGLRVCGDTFTVTAVTPGAEG